MKTIKPSATDDRKIQACRLSRRPADLLMIAHAPQQTLAAMPMRELFTWNEGVAMALSRERNKSMARHWSYDLNRHIALKLARDRIKAELSSRTRCSA